jgi:hypothetical protein
MCVDLTPGPSLFMATAHKSVTVDEKAFTSFVKHNGNRDFLTSNNRSQRRSLNRYALSKLEMKAICLLIHCSGTPNLVGGRAKLYLVLFAWVRRLSQSPAHFCPATEDAAALRPRKGNN